MEMVLPLFPQRGHGRMGIQQTVRLKRKTQYFHTSVQRGISTARGRSISTLKWKNHAPRRLRRIRCHFPRQGHPRARKTSPGRDESSPPTTTALSRLDPHLAQTVVYPNGRALAQPLTSNLESKPLQRFRIPQQPRQQKRAPIRQRQHMVLATRISTMQLDSPGNVLVMIRLNERAL